MWGYLPVVQSVGDSRSEGANRRGLSLLFSEFILQTLL
jgi:hypothetical protein